MYTLDDAREDMRDMFCSNCRDYKGMTTDVEGNRYCMFCE